MIKENPELKNKILKEDDKTKLNVSFRSKTISDESKMCYIIMAYFSVSNEQ